METNLYQAYEATTKETMSQRELEASVLTRAGLMLKRCQENWGGEESTAKLDEAIRFNQMIWSFFQSELVQEDNPLPKELRQNILNLSMFIDKRLFEMIASADPEKLTPVIDIDFNLAAGLRTETAEAA